MKKTTPKVLAFDVFGTVVDWHGSIVNEVSALGLNINAADFARSWRAGYKPAMARVMSGELGWTRIDDLHRMTLDASLEEFGVSMDAEAADHLNLVWHRLNPWPDTVEGLHKLRQQHTICTLSNGNLSLLADMAKAAELPWDLILSAEVFKAYKPHPDTYLGVAGVFDVQPEEVMLVAAHFDDLQAAGECGLQTAYIERPAEFGVDALKDVSEQAFTDYHAKNFLHLAELLS
jgi:2-haloacid dehalogenase